MEWLYEIIKHINASITFTASLFITSTALIIGPSYYPSLFNELDGKWKIGAVGMAVFSATMIIVWLIPKLWQGAMSIFTKGSIALSSKSLSANEKDLIPALGRLADESLNLRNLRNLNYSEVGLSKLEVLALSKKLSGKGLVDINMFEENLISLSSLGRDKAIKLMASEKT